MGITRLASFVSLDVALDSALESNPLYGAPNLDCR
jgi:hypothetical protein